MTTEPTTTTATIEQIDELITQAQETAQACGELLEELEQS